MAGKDGDVRGDAGLAKLVDRIAEVVASGRRGALATVIRTSGSTPQQPGARLLLTPEGELWGTVGGGAIEEEVRSALAACLTDGRPRTLTRDLGQDLGMCCGGRMEVFVEAVCGMPRLVIFGAGHVGQATARVARSVGFEVVVVDDRDELNTAARFPECERILAEPAAATAEVGATATDWLLVVTHDHRLDEEALATYAAGPHHYLGMIGSRRKVLRIVSRLAAADSVPPLERVYTPVGLDIGAVTPEEIAVSVVAELVALRRGAKVPHLRALDQPRLRKVIEGKMSVEVAARLDEEERGLTESATE